MIAESTPGAKLTCMAEPVTNELIYEVLRALQGQMALLRDDIANVKARLTSVDSRLGLIHSELALAHTVSRTNPIGSTGWRAE